ncbi:methyltransferase [Trypanosoma conorhini]|uniref:Methyltransferase n=1 Tax=Trypanosoma conorhini TaxID=83891 RepID=A0A422Q8N7_9TRYP|nr:methyltransferase [Trypanosoma conorhini]RNF26342.1 methyltransferase [Trypanosoma conorhini]
MRLGRPAAAPASRLAPALALCRQRRCSSSTSPVQPQPQTQTPQRAFRRTKRTNYADREQVLFPVACSLPARGEAPEGAPPPLRAGAAAVTSTHATPASLTRGDRMELRRSAVVLNALATPVVGRLVYYGLTAMAYVGYGIGRVSFYTRQSLAPPLPSPVSSSTWPGLASSTASSAAVQHLIEMGAYEQAATAAAAGGGLQSAASGGVDVPLFRGILHGTALECLYVGLSPIHSRGLMTTRDLPRGTRIITEPRRSYMDAANFVPLLADTHVRLPDTWHYTHPSGTLLELVTQPLPHHLINHSCDPNVCSGLSREFWPAAAASANAELLDRIRGFSHFEDPNSFFTTRDVPAGSELTLSYAHRVAPLFSGEDPLQKFFMLCRCGSPTCRHFVYRPPDDVMRHLTRRPRRWRGGSSSRKGRNHDDDDDDVASLLRLGFDDETVLLSLLPSRARLLAYVRTHLAPSRRTVAKGRLLASYRHVFKLLNEAAPQRRGERECARRGMDGTSCAEKTP